MSGGNIPYTEPSPGPKRLAAKRKAVPISTLATLKTIDTISNFGPDIVRFVKAYENVMNFYYSGIFELQVKHGNRARDDLEQNAPYDYQELDDYHMRDHMVIRESKNPKDVAGESEGVEIESQAGYSGLLEYGMAIHGKQYVFFRPIVEITQGSFKNEVIQEMTRAIKT